MQFLLLGICLVQTVSAFKKSSEALYENLSYRPDRIDKEFILNEGNDLNDEDATTKYFSGATLAYITPWNNKGYDLAKRTARKLDIISPVWFQVKPKIDGKLDCTITGGHDIDRNWLEALRTENEDVKILPRIIFEEWSPQLLQKLLSDTVAQRRCASTLSNFFTRNQFEGVVLDGYLTLLATMGKIEAKPLIIEFFDTISSTFHKNKMQIVYALPPLQEQTKVLTSLDVKEMTESADYVQIMTYDYHGQKYHGIAPYGWVEEILDALKWDEVNMKKVMIGLNWYGYERTKTKQDAIKSDGFFERLSNIDTDLQWDEQSHEHYFFVNKNTVVYYPTVASLELRTNLAADYEVGLAIWDYGQGLDSFCQVF